MTVIQKLLLRIVYQLTLLLTALGLSWYFYEWKLAVVLFILTWSINAKISTDEYARKNKK